MSDAPDSPDVEARGGKLAGDPGMEGAGEIGRQGIGKSDTSDWADDTSSRELPAEKGGAATGGGT